MKRTLIVLLLALVPAPASTPPDELLARVAAFHKPYNTFMRTLLGCPKQAIDISQCDATQGTIDYANFMKAAKAAKKLFPE